MPEYCFDEIAINSKEKKKPTEEDKYTYIGLEHLDTGSLTVSRWGSEIAPTGDKLVMRKGDVLFGKRRAYQKKVAIAPFDGIFSAHGMVLRPREEVITKDFFPLFISSDYFLDEAIKISVGSLSPTINWSDLKELSFTIPSLEEQKKLAPVIWAAIDTKNAYKKLLLGIDELVKSQFIEMFGDPVNNDCQWPTQALGSVCTTIVDCPHSTPSYTSENTGYMCIRTSIVKKNRILWDEIEYIPEHEYKQRIQRKRPEKGDSVYTREGAILGIAAIIDRECNVALGQRSMLLSPNTNMCLPQFLCIAMNFDSFLRKALGSVGGSASPHINVGDIKSFEIILPPIELQAQFAAFVEQSDKSKFVVEQLLNIFHHIHLTVKED